MIAIFPNGVEWNDLTLFQPFHVKSSSVGECIEMIFFMSDSHFTGIALLLPYCSYLDIVEYMPSTRLTSRCHYYDSEVYLQTDFFRMNEIVHQMEYNKTIHFQMNSGCTFGTWHPLAAEKLMTYDMNIANDFSTFQNGVIRIRKPNNNGCNLWIDISTQINQIKSSRNAISMFYYHKYKQRKSPFFFSHYNFNWVTLHTN